MAHYLEVSETGQAFLSLIRDHLYPETIEKPEQIDFCHPAQAEELSLGIHLYDISENSENRQTDMLPSGLTHQQFPPLPLTLSYMITAYTAPEILIPKVMGLLYDHPILNPSAESEKTYIQLLPLTAREKMDLWRFSNTPYQLSLFYSLSPVFLKSARRVQISRVVSTEFTVTDLSL